MSKVLIVDDDVDLTAMLSQFLIREGFQVHVVHDGETGVEEATGGDYSVVVMDIMMPRISGIEALRRIRNTSNVPVLMLTARGDNIDRIVGLDMGADDYVPKPFNPGELVARIRAILRRVDGRDSATTNRGARELQAGGLKLWLGSRRAQWHDQPLELTGTEYTLLEVLARHAGQLVSRQDISMQAFGQPLGPFDRRIDVHISSIRQKLGMRSDGQSWIQSVRGQGYQLLED
ncbi:response regulator transcription factor [Aquabacterium sp. CECT 9606]|uniref:response regulator transcription factor n=1 Tax=Aquabacterium sp. CECT 9606 TaxID=2845822 RepID=UPI001E44CACB|nr:response regulator transcription factor [Aquabacterium sp. CECT 9606]CAH0352376.1 Transcriptional regulatory protein CpxR [Aquabacterium sp. CECT 9606]